MSQILNDDIRNVIIIGSGPSGYTAALYTARANLQPLLIAGSLDPKTSRIKGGQLMFTSDIENFPGAIEDGDADVENVKGVSGPELMHRMEIQAKHFGAEMIEEFVTEVVLDEKTGIHTVKTEYAGEFKTRALIIATGAASRRLGIAAEDTFYGQGGGVSTCATCDGSSFRTGPQYPGGGTVAVIGGGDSAFEEASYLAGLTTKHVHLIHRRDEFRASKIMVERAMKNPKITVHTFKAVEDLKGKPHPLAEKAAFFKGKEVLAAAVLKDTRTGELTELPLDGLFVAIGHIPNTGLFKDVLLTDDEQYLERDKNMRALKKDGTAFRGVFVAGDVSDHVYRQAITAAGMGCMAAIEVERFLAEAIAEEMGVDSETVHMNAESLAQSHWSSERDEAGEKPMVERIVEAAEHK